MNFELETVKYIDSYQSNHETAELGNLWLTSLQSFDGTGPIWCKQQDPP